MLRAFLLAFVVALSFCQGYTSTDEACQSYSAVIRDNLMEVVIRHIQNTVVEKKVDEIKLGKLKSMSPTSYFEDRFGSKASAASLIKFSLTLSYVEAPRSKLDDSMLREAIYRSAVLGDMDEARQSLGKLLLLTNNLKTLEGGVDKRCLDPVGRQKIRTSLKEELEWLQEDLSNKEYDEFIGVQRVENSDYVADKYFSILPVDESTRPSRAKRSVDESQSIKSNQDYVIIAKRSFPSSEENVEMKFVVDSSVTTVVVEATKQCGGMKVFTNLNNDTVGRPMTWGEQKLTLKLNVTKRFGEWTVRSKGSTKKGCKLTASALSTMGFFLTTVAPSADGLKVLRSNPTPYHSFGGFLDFYGMKRSRNSKYTGKQVRLVDGRGIDVVPPIKLDSTSLSNDNNTAMFFIEAGLDPYKSFRVVVEGSNAEGATFMRTSPSLISLSNILIEYNIDTAALKPGKTSKIPVSVTNYGPEEFIALEVEDEMEMTKMLPRSRKIATNETRIFNLFFDVPEEVAPGSWSKAVVLGRSKRSLQVNEEVAVIPFEPPMKITSITVKGVINSRYAETVITTVVQNNFTTVKKAEVSLMLPPDSFVTNFTMKIAEKIIVGQVEEKVKAEKIFDKAKETGVSAGTVATRKKSKSDFRQKMLTAPNETIHFIVTYQQLLKRFNGAFDYSIILNPGQPVKHFMVDVHITEDSPLSFVRSPGFGEKGVLHDPKTLTDVPGNGSLITMSHDGYACHVQYKPTLDEQSRISPLGLDGAYTVLYDVAEAEMYGSFNIENGYFNHFYSARMLPKSPKVVYYIVDKSGSMDGVPIMQARDAVIELISLLDEQDYFNVQLFDSSRYNFRENLVRATKENKQAATDHVILYAEAGGGTEIEWAFHNAFQIFDQYLQPRAGEGILEVGSTRYLNIQELKDHRKMICFLSDGEDYEAGDQTRLNQGRVKIHTVSFGSYADEELMEKIALKNGGEYRSIYEDISAKTQVKDFFYGITSAALTDVQFQYDNIDTKSLTTDTFDWVIAGQEVVVSGRYDLLDSAMVEEDNDDFGRHKIGGKMLGRGVGGSEVVVNFEVETTKTSRISTAKNKVADFSERIWAFMTIQELLKKAKLADDDSAVQNETNARALELSLEYNFVTPLTSIVVLKDEDRAKIMAALRAEEKKARNAALLTTTISPTTAPSNVATTTAWYTPVYTSSVGQGGSGPGGYGAGGYGAGGYGAGGYGAGVGGVFRDPHVVLPLTSGVTLCFNWNGKDNEVHNLIYHRKTGLAVNGKMVKTSAGVRSETGKPRVYLYSISFIVPQTRANFVVTPDNITVSYYGMDSFTLPVTSIMSLNRDGVILRIFEVSARSVKVSLSIDGINYEMILYRKSRVPHLDFGFNDLSTKNTGGQLDGIIGQFYGRGLHLIKSEEGKHAILRVGDEIAEVKEFTMKANPITNQQESCWLSARGTHGFSKHGEANAKYIVETLETSPVYEVHKSVKATGNDVIGKSTDEKSIVKSTMKKSSKSLLSALFRR